MAPRSAKPQSVNGVKKGAAAATAMPPPVSASASNNNKQNFSFDIVSALLLIMRERGITISRTHYELMSALDGNRTADAFQHQFRAALARAKMLHEQRERGVEFEAVKPMAKGKGKGKGVGDGGNNNKRKRKDGVDVDGGVNHAKKKTPKKSFDSIKHEPGTDTDEDTALSPDAMAGKSPSSAKFYDGKASEELFDDFLVDSSADEIKTESM